MIDLDHGTTPKAKVLIGSLFYQDLVDNRVNIVERMNTGNPRYLCSECLTPVYLVSTPDKRFFFRHRSEENDSCSAKTRSELSAEEITARKYHGLRESWPHKQIKGLIERSLLADAAFGEIAVERNWKAADSKRYRRPDVQAGSPDGKVAFEVQLSTTFLSVVAGRRIFYRSEGGLLVWVFGSFDAGYRRLTTDDLLYSNNSNIFIVDEETTLLSEQTGVFHLRCHHRKPVRQGSRVVDEWVEQIVPFRDLTQDRDGQRLFLFDFQAAEAAIRAAIQQEADDERAMAIRSDQADLYEFWVEHGRSFRHTPENRTAWQQLRDRYECRGLSLPKFPDSDEAIRVMLSALYSAREGRPVGYKFSKLVQVAHQVAEAYPGLFIAFYSAVEAYGHAGLLKSQDSSGKWRERLKGSERHGSALEGIFSRIRRNDPELRPETSVLPLMNFLFPEVSDRVAMALCGDG
ncbi:hypothetical protein GGQ88_003752 [Novosphingobium hassiacum]|uniref:Competence protein n=1 Tax=Novosphingobium hassiacum TaxID=173676 RepID=A0A7W5ZZQ0_9SPHN|nr:hypothetical protein [Novosphingobium hassiacum]